MKHNRMVSKRLDIGDGIIESLKYQSMLNLSLIKRPAVTVILLSYFYVFMEWVFYVTKPSFMDLLTLAEKVKILLISGLTLSLLSLLVLAVIFLLEVFLTPVFPAFRKYANHFPSAFMFASLFLILLDNFTYTVFNFGIVDSKTFIRVMYGLGFVGVLVYFLILLAVASEQPPKQFLSKLMLITTITLFSVSLIFTCFTFKNTNSIITLTGQNSNKTSKPNIILFGTDGLNADNMSLYGYTRDTTPFISEMAQSSLISENNFSNAASSLGSDTATLTGKLPITTRVIYSPDILHGIDEYQHMPGLLKINGYRTVFLGEPYYDDVNAVNFQNAFDAVDCEENTVGTTSSFFSGYGFDEEIYFLTTLEGRIRDRLEHIFFIQDMINPLTQVSQSEIQYTNDQERMRCLFSGLERANQTDQPLFVQVHLEATHGGEFSPSTRLYSEGETENPNISWETDFYDDTILDFDAEVKELVQYLKHSGQFNNTILIIYTDHAQQYLTQNKIPLILHFPNDQYAGTITKNTQNIDIAPTILDYLNIDQPTWMEGSSLLKDLDSNRLIIDPTSIPAILNSKGWYFMPSDTIKPPFYQFGYLTVIQCQNWFVFNLQKMTVEEGIITNYVNPCPEKKLDTLEVIREKAGAILVQHGFDVPNDW